MGLLGLTSVDASWMPDSSRLVHSASTVVDGKASLYLADILDESVMKLRDGSGNQVDPAERTPTGKRVNSSSPNHLEVESASR